jgi:hypothetical protein
VTSIAAAALTTTTAAAGAENPAYHTDTQNPTDEPTQHNTPKQKEENTHRAPPQSRNNKHFK